MAPDSVDLQLARRRAFAAYNELDKVKDELGGILFRLRQVDTEVRVSRALAALGREPVAAVKAAVEAAVRARMSVARAVAEIEEREAYQADGLDRFVDVAALRRIEPRVDVPLWVEVGDGVRIGARGAGTSIG